jgi:hypothetical protein
VSSVSPEAARLNLGQLFVVGRDQLHIIKTSRQWWERPHDMETPGALDNIAADSPGRRPPAKRRLPAVVLTANLVSQEAKYLNFFFHNEG